MKTLVLEIRDRATFIPAIAIVLEPENGGQVWLLRRAGYGFDDYPPCVLLMRAAGGEAHYSPYDWADRTMASAHRHIVMHAATLRDGDVVDVEYVLGETEAPRRSERDECRV